MNAISARDATAALLRCCGSQVWAEAVAAARPFEDAPALLRIAERAWWTLGDADHLEAFSAHPKIGQTSTSTWANAEQAGAAVAAAATLAALAEGNRAYEAKYGFIYIVCASGRSADALLADLHARLKTSRSEELRTAAEEQAKITRLRLIKLLGDLA